MELAFVKGEEVKPPRLYTKGTEPSTTERGTESRASAERLMP